MDGSMQRAFGGTLRIAARIAYYCGLVILVCVWFVIPLSMFVEGLRELFWPTVLCGVGAVMSTLWLRRYVAEAENEDTGA